MLALCRWMTRRRARAQRGSAGVSTGSDSGNDLKRALLKGHGFEIIGAEFVRREKTETSTFAFEHVRATPVPTLRAELARLPRK